jgi:hypothetical protein
MISSETLESREKGRARGAPWNDPFAAARRLASAVPVSRA